MKKNISIKKLLIFFSVLQILLISGIIILILTKESRDLGLEASFTVKDQYKEKIKYQIKPFFDIPTYIIDINHSAIINDMINHKDPEHLLKNFMSQTAVFETVNSIYFGNPEGGIINAGRETDSSLYIIRSENFKAGSFYKYSVSESGQPLSIIDIVEDFDARRRPWYKNAAKSRDRSVWSQVYPLFTGQDLAISASRAVYAQDDTLLGVLSVDIFLSKIGVLLSSIDFSPNAMAYIIDADGYLIASSSPVSLFDKDAQRTRYTRTMACESNNDRIRKSALFLLDNYITFDAIAEKEKLNFYHAGDNYLISSLAFSPSAEINWNIITLVPEKDILHKVYIARRRALLFTAIAVAFSLLFGLLIAGWISRPLVGLNKFLKEYEPGHSGSLRSDSFIKETSELGQAFKKLGEKLEKTITLLQKEIKERKTAQKILFYEKEFHRIALESIGDGLIRTDENRIIIMMNKTAQKKTGWDERDAMGEHIDSVFKIYDKPSEQRLISQDYFSNEEDIHSPQMFLLSRTGIKSSIMMSIANIKDPDGKKSGYIIIFQDITEKEKLAEFSQRTDKLESIGYLSSNIANDFNNLLGGIFGFLSLAKNSLGKHENKAEGMLYIDKAISSFDKAKELTQQIQLFSKYDRPDLTKGNIGPVLRDCASSVLSYTNIQSRIDVPDDLTDCYFDNEQIARVFANILRNARQATKDGGIVYIMAENAEYNNRHYIRVTVKDHGEGIKQEDLKKIFDPYWTTKKDADGLGLAVSHSIIRNHGGMIEVDSEQGKGSAFIVYIPAIIDLREIHQENTGSKTESIGKILVLDDEDFIIDMLKDMLESIGFEIQYAGTGEAMLELVSKSHAGREKISAIVLDLNIHQGIGGKEIIRKIREYYPEIPVFAASGYITDPAMVKPSEHGFTDSISKPFMIDDLAEMFSKYLS